MGLARCNLTFCHGWTYKDTFHKLKDALGAFICIMGDLPRGLTAVGHYPVNKQ
jgi:hypothetical protein